MDKARFTIESFVRKPGLLILAFVLVLIIPVLSGHETVTARAKKDNKRETIRQAAQDWIRVGTRQYKRNFYKQAEQSLLRALENQEYLSAAERVELNVLLEKTRMAEAERSRVLQIVRSADELAELNQLVNAKVQLEKVRTSEFLTKEQQKLVAERLKKIDSQVIEQKRQIVELYNRSMEFYLAGRLEKAREGFTKISNILASPKFLEPTVASPAESARQGAVAVVGQPNADKPATEIIEDELPDSGAESVQEAEPQKPQSEMDKPAMIEVLEPVNNESGPAKISEQRRNIIRDHTKAVVNDAVAKSRRYISLGEFDEASKVLQAAQQIVNEKQSQLGDGSLKQYSDKLGQLSEEIARQKNRRLLGSK